MTIGEAKEILKPEFEGINWGDSMSKHIELDKCAKYYVRGYNDAKK